MSLSTDFQPQKSAGGWCILPLTEFENFAASAVVPLIFMAELLVAMLVHLLWHHVSPVVRRKCGKWCACCQELDPTVSTVLQFCAHAAAIRRVLRFRGTSTFAESCNCFCSHTRPLQRPRS